MGNLKETAEEVDGGLWEWAEQLVGLVLKQCRRSGGLGLHSSDWCGVLGIGVAVDQRVDRK